MTFRTVLSSRSVVIISKHSIPHRRDNAFFHLALFLVEISAAWLGQQLVEQGDEVRHAIFGGDSHLSGN
jgi:hypothetical protein